MRDGLRFDRFFTGYGVLEDAHFALQAKQAGWTLLEDGRAHCVHLHTAKGREDHRRVARKTATNYRYVFIDLVPERSVRQEIRFWWVQIFDLLRFFVYAIRHPAKAAWMTTLGKLEGILEAARMHSSGPYKDRGMTRDG